MSTFGNSLKPLLTLKAAASCLISIGILAGLYLLSGNKILIFATTAILFSASLLLQLRFKSDSVASGILTAIVCVVIAYYFKQSWSSFNDIVEYDFLAFYVYGKAAADGLAFYDPKAFTHIMESISIPYHVSDVFDLSVIKVGVCYPPTTMLMLAPLGYLNVDTANLVWRTLILSFLALDMYLIFRTFKLSESPLLQILIVAALSMMLPGSSTTIALSQTNFFMLFFILLIFKNPDNWRSGILLALAVVIKPIAAVWSLYYIVNRKWKPIFAFAATGIVLILISILSFGLDNFLPFFLSPPSARFPAFVFTEDINQSMNAVFLRLNTHSGLGLSDNIVGIIVICISLIITILSCIVSYRLSKSNPKMAFLVFLPLSLLIYPGCLMHYAVQLLPLLFYILEKKNITAFVWSGIFLLVLSFSSFLASTVVLIVISFYAFQNKPVFGRNEDGKLSTVQLY